MHRFDDHRQPQFGGHLPGIGGFAPGQKQGPAHLQAGLLIQHFAQFLVHRQSTAQNAGALVGNVQEVQHALEGAVLAAPAVEDHQGRVEVTGIVGQALQVVSGVVAADVVPGLVQGLIDLFPAV